MSFYLLYGVRIYAFNWELDLERCKEKCRYLRQHILLALLTFNRVACFYMENHIRMEYFTNVTCEMCSNFSILRSITEKTF